MKPQLRTQAPLSEGRLPATLHFQFLAHVTGTWVGKCQVTKGWHAISFLTMPVSLNSHLDPSSFVQKPVTK